MKFEDINIIAEANGYHFCKDLNDSKKINLYDKNTHYVESATIDRGIIKFNGEQYKTLDTIKDCIDVMSQVGNSKEFIAQYYDPTIRRMWAAESVVRDYMQKLGFTKDNKYCGYNKGGDIERYVIYNIYGHEIISVKISFNNWDNESGYVYRDIKDCSWVQIPFNDIHECISAINTIVESETVIGTKSLFKVHEAMTQARNYNSMVACSVDINTLSVNRDTNMKEKVRKMLEEALASLDD